MKFPSSFFSGMRYSNPFYEKRHELRVDRYTGSRFLGNSMFWKHLGKIHPKYVYRADSIEYRSIKVMITESILMVSLVLIFSVSLYLRYVPGLDFSNAMQSSYWSSGIESVSTLDGLWEWMGTSLVAKVYSSRETFQESNSGLVPPPKWLSMTPSESSLYVAGYGIFSLEDYPSWSPYLVGGEPFRSNVLLGPVRVRQYAVSADGSELREKAAEVDVPSDLASAYTWVPANITQQYSTTSSTSGITYPASGFVFDFSQSMATTKDQLSLLRNASWIDSTTRAITIEVSVLNTRLEAVSNTVILAEISADAFSIPNIESQTVPIIIPSSELSSSFLMSIAAFAMFTAYGIFMVNSFFMTGIFDYFTYFWNLVDIALITLYFIYIGGVLIEESEVPSALSPILSPLQSMFRPFSFYTELASGERNFAATVAILAWIRVVKVLALFGPFRLSIKVTESVVSYLALLMIPVVAIAWILAAIFAPIFPTITDAVYGIFFIYSHSVDLLPSLWNDHQGAGVVWLSVFLLFMWLIVPGILVGTALRAFRVYAEELEEAQAFNDSDRQSLYPPGVDLSRWWHRDVVSVFIFTWIWRLRGVDLFKEPEEDVGFPEEQEIELLMLPDIIQRRWADKKAELTEIVEVLNTKKRKLSVGRSSKFGDRMTRLMSAVSKTQSQLMKSFTGLASRTKLGLGPLTIFSISSAKSITRIQLQRLLDSDKELVEVLKSQESFDVSQTDRDSDSSRPSSPSSGTCPSSLEPKPMRLRAIDVIRKFNTPKAVSKVMVVSALLAGVNGQSGKSKVKDGLADILVEVEAAWKDQLASLMESVNALTEDLIDLRKAVDNRALLNT